MDALQPPPLASALLVAAIIVIGNASAIGMTWLGATGRLPYDGIAGIKTPATRSSPSAWEAGHRAAMPWTAWLGGASILAGLTSIPAAATPGGYLLALGIAVAAALAGVVAGVAAAHRSARRLGSDR